MKRQETIETICVLCASSDCGVGNGFASVLDGEPDILVVGETENGDKAVELFRLRRPHVTLIDLMIPSHGGIDAIRSIRAEAPQARIVGLASCDDNQEIYRALEAGVWGYILKEKARTDAAQAIRTVHSGKRPAPPEIARKLRERSPETGLTPREVQVLRLASQGRSNQEISYELGATFGTVKIHMQNILCKLRAADRTHAVTIGLHRGLISTDEPLNELPAENRQIRAQSLRGICQTALCTHAAEE
jgi:DNA-binding NarL/FixJ family response regulator